MYREYSKLFEPISIGGTEIKNRFFMAPMGNFGYTDQYGAISQNGIDYFTERANGGVGLIFTGFCIVNENIEKVETPSILVIKDNPTEFIKKSSILTEKVHAYGAKIFLQLTAGFGRGANIVKVNKRIAPSDIENKHNKSKLHKAMTIEEIQYLIESYGNAALIAKRSGFDGVEVHAIHEGYLLDQFTLACTNHRTDSYGGTNENRYRIAKDIVEEIKKACGNNYPVTIRYSVKHYMKSLTEGMLPEEANIAKEFGRDTQEGIELAKYLEKAGYDALNVDVGSYEAHYLCHPNVFTKDGLYLDAASQVAKEVSIPVLVAGRMDNLSLALDAVNTHKCDMIGFGRPLLADAEIVNKIKNGELNRIRHCISCNYGCITNRMKHFMVRCAVNPQCYMEKENKLNPISKEKNVVVIGGGPAGMQAALTAAMRGHKVTLYEEKAVLGGNLNYAGAILYKHHIIELVNWFWHELNAYGVDIKQECRIDEKNLRELKADAVVFATGSRARLLKFEGSDLSNVMLAHQSYERELKGKKLIIIGAGAIGMETAIWFSKQENNVTVLEFTDRMMGGKGNVAGGDYSMVESYIKYYGINLLLNHLLTRFDGQYATVADLKNGENKILEADNIIVSVGYESQSQLYKKAINECSVNEIYNIGDSNNVANIYFAIHDAYEIANNI